MFGAVLEKFQAVKSCEAIIFEGKSYSFSWLVNAITQWECSLVYQGVQPGKVVAFVGDFSPHAIALLFALVKLNCILVPLSEKTKMRHDELVKIAEVDVKISLSSDGVPEFERYSQDLCKHSLIGKLRNEQHPGLIIFSSGSSGKSKATVHDFFPLLNNNLAVRPAKRIIPFLMFDHIGGLNTMLYTLLNGGCLIVLDNRSPDAVCCAIENFKAEVLPTSPTFLKLLLLSKAYKNHCLDSLELVTYGTEVMPQTLLDQLNHVFSNIKFKQNYGMSEIGVLRASSKSSNSLFMRIDKRYVDYRVVDGLLEVNVASTMLGYLNADSPFTKDGWLRTGDQVEIEGEYIRILGRQSDMINVGGEKVSPSEVEAIIEAMPGVESAVIVAEANSLLGQIVKVAVKLSVDEARASFKQRLNDFCKDKLLPYQIPKKVQLVKEGLYSHRFKKLRKIA